MSFCVEYWHVLVYNLDDKLKAPWQIRYSGKDLHIFPGWYSIPLWYLLDSWENDAFFYPQQTAMYCCPVPWGALSNNWVSCKVYQFWIYLLHENTWKHTFIISGEIIWKKKYSPWRITFSCKICEPISTTWIHGKKRTYFLRNSSQWLLLDIAYIFYYNWWE